MASKPKIAPPPPPVVSPPVDETVHAGTRDDPYVYSDGTPIVYLDGEDQVAYTARVQAMVDAAQVPESPVVPDNGSVVPTVGPDEGSAAAPPDQSVSSGGVVGASPSAVPADPDGASVPPVSTVGQSPATAVPATAVPGAPPTIPGSDIPVAPAAPLIPAPPAQPVVGAGSQTSPAIPPVSSVPVAAGVQPAPPPPVMTATTAPPIVKPPSPPAPPEAALSDTDAGILPGHFNTMDDYLAAQRAGAAQVDAAYAEANANKTVAEMTPDEIAALEEADAVDQLSVDDRLRRLEQHMGLRSPRAKA